MNFSFKVESQELTFYIFPFFLIYDTRDFSVFLQFPVHVVSALPCPHGSSRCSGVTHFLCGTNQPFPGCSTRDFFPLLVRVGVVKIKLWFDESVV